MTAIDTSAPAAEASVPDMPVAARLTRAEISRRLLDYGKPLLGVLGLSVTFRVIQMSLGVALFGIGAWGVGTVLTEGPDRTVGGVVVAMVVVAFVKAVIRYLEQFSGHYVAFKLLAMLRNTFYRELEPQAPAGLAGRHTGDLLARVMKDIDRVEVFYAHTVAPTLAAIIVPALALAYLFIWHSWAIAATLLPFLVLIGLVVPVWSSSAASNAATDLRVARGRLSQHVTDGIQGIREVLAFGYGGRRLAELEALGHDAERAHTRMSRMMAARRGFNELFVGGGLVAVLLVAGSQVTSGTMTWPDLAVVMAVTLLTFGPVLGVEEFIADLEQTFASARRIWDVTDRPPTVTEPAAPVPATGLEPTLAFEGVSFRYPGADPDLTPNAVDGVDVTVPANKTVGLVGASGSGKSTMVSLALRFWDPDRGTIRIGGTDIRDLALSDLRELIAVVDQRTYLFNDTIAANLRIARPDATDEELEAVCRAAHLHETVTALPDGYDTVIGEMGERLSGGQRQRLAIARALLKNAPILILDEATSQLDVHTEAAIQSDLAELGQGRTVLSVAHRLSTVRDADEIVVLDRGQVIERGPHEELLACGGAYAQLWARQAGDLETALAD